MELLLVEVPAPVAVLALSPLVYWALRSVQKVLLPAKAKS